jgi:YidC/Oxa1 family membrane protein insertase
MALLSAIGTWASTYVGVMGMEQDNPSYKMMKNMSMIMPIMIFFIGLSLPGAMALYWFIGSIFTVAQTLFFKREKIKQIRDKVRINKIK